MNNEQVIEKVSKILSELQPMIASHSGAITFEKMENGIVYVKLDGACSTCPASIFTLTYGIEEKLREQLPDIKGVMPVID